MLAVDDIFGGFGALPAARLRERVVAKFVLHHQRHIAREHVQHDTGQRHVHGQYADIDTQLFVGWHMHG